MRNRIWTKLHQGIELSMQIQQDLKDQQISLGYWALGAQFLSLAYESCFEIVDSGNKLVVIVKPTSHNQFNDADRWSDHRVGIPVLFSFYHGIELILKGFLAATGNQIHKPHHRLTELLSNFESDHPNTDLAKQINVALNPWVSTPTGNFLEQNNITIDDWYEALKYLASKKKQQFSHTHLKYGGHTTVSFWNHIHEQSLTIRKEAARLSKSLGYA